MKTKREREREKKSPKMDAICKKAELGVKEKVVEGNKKLHNNQDNCPTSPH